MKRYFVYILASRRDGVLYIGVTSDLEGRILKHKLGEYEGFTKKYHVHKLVWFEEYGNIYDAIEKEKRLKMEPRVEDRPDRERQPGLVGLVLAAHRSASG